jgi:hypothetical protein
VSSPAKRQEGDDAQLTSGIAAAVTKEAILIAPRTPRAHRKFAHATPFGLLSQHGANVNEPLRERPCPGEGLEYFRSDLIAGAADGGSQMHDTFVGRTVELRHGVETGVEDSFGGPPPPCV